MKIDIDREDIVDRKVGSKGRISVRDLAEPGETIEIVRLDD